MDDAPVRDEARPDRCSGFDIVLLAEATGGLQRGDDMVTLRVGMAIDAIRDLPRHRLEAEPCIGRRSNAAQQSTTSKRS